MNLTPNNFRTSFCRPNFTSSWASREKHSGWTICFTTQFACFKSTTFLPWPWASNSMEDSKYNLLFKTNFFFRFSCSNMLAPSSFIHFSICVLHSSMGLHHQPQLDVDVLPQLLWFAIHCIMQNDYMRLNLCIASPMGQCQSEIYSRLTNNSYQNKLN